MSDHKNADEIDLLKVILKSINFTRRNFLLLLVIFIVGTAIGIAYNASLRKVYQSKMIISSSILTKMFTTKLIETANRYLDEGNYKGLATQFNIPETITQQIRKLKIEGVVDDELKETDKFLITADVYEPEILTELQKGLVHYLENNEYVKIRVNQNTNYTRQMIAEVDKEIQDMEKFKLRIYEGDFFQKSGSVMFDPTTVNTKILELKKEKLTLQNTLQLISSVQIISGFTKFDKPSEPMLLNIVGLGLFIGAMFVGAFLAFKGFSKLMRMADGVK